MQEGDLFLGSLKAAGRDVEALRVPWAVPGDNGDPPRHVSATSVYKALEALERRVPAFVGALASAPQGAAGLQHFFTRLAVPVGWLALPLPQHPRCLECETVRALLTACEKAK